MAHQVMTGRFVGRTEELALLLDLLARAAAGESLVALVGGEAGVGKTRLADQLAICAHEQGVRVLRGGCVPLGEEGVPFAPVIEALRGLAGELDPAELEKVAGPAHAELGRLLPDLAWSGTVAAGPDAATPPRGEAGTGSDIGAELDADLDLAALAGAAIAATDGMPPTRLRSRPHERAFSTRPGGSATSCRAATTPACAPTTTCTCSRSPPTTGCSACSRQARSSPRPSGCRACGCPPPRRTCSSGTCSPRWCRRSRPA